MQSTLQVSRSPQRQRVSIGHLPVELIMMIFHEVYKLGLGWWAVEGSEHPPLASVDFPSSTLFPDALAMVCSAWREMLSSVPSFWTRVVVAIDGNATHCPVKGSFEWSRPLPIDVLISHSSYDENPGEGHRVEAIMQYLVPELHRCRSIRFNTIHVSSLPPLQAFSGQAPLLRELEFGCTPYDPWAEEEPGDVAVPLELMCPELETLHLNGRNFCNVCPPLSETAPSFAYDLWLSHLPNLTSLTISNYRVGYGNDGLSMAGMLRALQELPSLAYLAIKNVEFDDVSPSHSYTLSSALSRLEFSHLSNGMCFFFGAVILQDRIDTLHVTRCDVDDVDWGNISCTELTLRMIDGRYDIGQILNHSDICELYVDRCPSFDDILVYSLMGKNHPFPEGVSARCLRFLDICWCDNFSMGALREMCEWRERRTWEEMSWQSMNDTVSTEFEVCTPITTVEVYRDGLTPEDMEWLKSYNSRFRRSYIPFT
ncbi:hypothetical protein PAXINDRAFT_132610 [Paxillus involutus ATCC 200175]|nr:hypothetical protein PAXINDRAFT_132610 [Paxillus involutus ATCC 200175]